MDTAREMVHMFEANYPEIMRKAYIINGNSITGVKTQSYNRYVVRSAEIVHNGVQRAKAVHASSNHKQDKYIWS